MPDANTSNKKANAADAESLYRPWPIAAAGVVALAMVASTSHNYLIPSVLALLMLSAYLTPFRIKGPWYWLFRVPLYAAVVFANASDDPNAQTFSYGLADPHYVSSMGQLIGAELVVQFWQLHPGGGARGSM